MTTSKPHTVPNGWTKGSPLTISKRVFYEGPRKFDFWSIAEVCVPYHLSGEIQPDHIAEQGLYSWDEFTAFIQWWYS